MYVRNQRVILLNFVFNFEIFAISDFNNMDFMFLENFIAGRILMIEFLLHFSSKMF